MRVRPTKAGYLVQKALVKHVREMVSERVLPLGAGTILDVGCGNAPYGDLLPGWRRIGINIDASDASPEVVGDGTCLPFRDACADAVLCTQVMEHVRDPFGLVRELARVLKPGGVLVLSGPMYWRLHEEPHDYWRFTRHGFLELARREGLEVLDLKDQGGALALVAVALNQLLLGGLLAPIRLAINLSVEALERIVHVRHSTPNLAMCARKPGVLPTRA
jgi:SAM-dependent methyltransferase